MGLEVRPHRSSAPSRVVGDESGDRREFRRGEARPRDFRDQEYRSSASGLSFYTKTHRLPSTDEGLAHLVASNHLEQLPMDPWGRPYQYNNDTGAPEIFSLGRDGLLGGDGSDADISSWDLAK